MWRFVQAMDYTGNWVFFALAVRLSQSFNELGRKPHTMKTLLRKLFSPILNIFEKGDEAYAYKSLNRKILLVIGVLFLGLGSAVAYLAFDNGDTGFAFPVLVFAAISLVTLVVGLLGNERAVAKIWGNR